MAKGLNLPVGTLQGRAVLIEGEEQLKKVIQLAVSDCESDNPFQEEGIGNDSVFDINDALTEQRLRRRVIDAFRALAAQGRARLDPSYPMFSRDSFNQELWIDIRYINLETTNTEDVQLKVGSGAGSTVSVRSV